MTAGIGEVGDSPVPCSEHELAVCDNQDRQQTRGSVIPRDSLIIRIGYQARSSVVDKKQGAGRQEGEQVEGIRKIGPRMWERGETGGGEVTPLR